MKFRLVVLIATAAAAAAILLLLLRPSRDQGASLSGPEGKVEAPAPRGVPPRREETPSPLESVTGKSLETKGTLERLLPRFMTARRVNRWKSMSLLGRERELSLTEARLLARIDPAGTLEWALSVVQDKGRSMDDLEFATFVLGILAGSGSAPAELALSELTKDPARRESAVRELTRSRDPEKWKPLFLELCSEGSPEAFYAISRSPEDSTRALMESLRNRPSEVRGEFKLLSNLVLKRQEVLLASDWQDRLRSVLERPPESVEQWTTWALVAAGDRRMPGLEEYLRARLDRDAENARKGDAQRALSLSGGPPPRSFEERYVTTGDPAVLADRCHDEVLLMVLDRGGKLNDLERRRLREFGYGPDPQARLRELFSERN